MLSTGEGLTRPSPLNLNPQLQVDSGYSLLIHLVMKRAIYFMVLLAFALTLPCANICAVTAESGEIIAALDICSPDSPGTTGDITTLTEPSYDINAGQQVAELPAEEPFIYESTVFSPEDRPPVV
jgi:hypothetical protein